MWRKHAREVREVFRVVLLNLIIDDVKQATAAVLFDSTASAVGGNFVEEV